MACIESDQKACGGSQLWNVTTLLSWRGGDLLLGTSSDIRQHFVNESPYALARLRLPFLERQIGIASACGALMPTARPGLLTKTSRTEFPNRSSTAFWVDLENPSDPLENGDVARGPTTRLPKRERRPNPSIYGGQFKLRRWRGFDAPRYRNY